MLWYCAHRGKELGKAMAILRSLLRLVCSLAVCVFAATIGSAAPAVGLKPAAGPPTTTITVSGSGFAASAAIDVYFDTGDLCLVIASGTGVFSCTIKVAKDVQPQQHWVSAVERGTQMGAQAPFIVRTDWAQFHGRNAAHNGFNRFENTLG